MSNGSSPDTPPSKRPATGDIENVLHGPDEQFEGGVPPGIITAAAIEGLDSW